MATLSDEDESEILKLYEELREVKERKEADPLITQATIKNIMNTIKSIEDGTRKEQDDADKRGLSSLCHSPSNNVSQGTNRL